MELHVLVGKLHEKNGSVFRGLRLWKNPWDIFVAFCRPFFSLLNNECFLTLAARLEKLTSIETEYQICHWQGLWLSNRKIINSCPCRYHFFSQNSPRQKWKNNKNLLPASGPIFPFTGFLSSARIRCCGCRVFFNSRDQCYCLRKQKELFA